MYTALRATSKTLVEYIKEVLMDDPLFAAFFNPGLGGTMQISLGTPQEMIDDHFSGLSVWLYKVDRDEERLNAPPVRISLTQVQKPPLPLRLHYLVTPVLDPNLLHRHETAHALLGKVLQAFYDHSVMRGADLQDDLEGTNLELRVCLEPLSLDEIYRIYDALEGPYQLSVSYEVSVVYIETALQPESKAPVQVVMPEYGLAAPEA